MPEKPISISPNMFGTIIILILTALGTFIWSDWNRGIAIQTQLEGISTELKNADLMSIKQNVSVLYNNYENNKDSEKKQNEILDKHLELLHWSKDQINEVRVISKLPLVYWNDSNSATNKSIQ